STACCRPGYCALKASGQHQLKIRVARAKQAPHGYRIQIRCAHLLARYSVAFGCRLSLPRLQTGHPRSKHNIPNRHTYEKLEVRLSFLLSVRVLVLIDTKAYFAQCTHIAARHFCGALFLHTARKEQSALFGGERGAGSAVCRSAARHRPKWLLCALRNCANPAPPCQP